MFTLYVRVNGETREIARTNIIECARAKVPLHIILAHVKRFPKNIIRFEEKAAAVIPIAMVAYKDSKSDVHIAECLQYLINENHRDWFVNGIEDIEAVTLDITIDEIGLSILNDTQHVEWADLSAISRVEIKRSGEDPYMIEEPLYAFTPIGKDREYMSVTVICNNVVQSFRQASLKMMRETADGIYNRMVLPRLTEEALSAPLLPPREVHMIKLTEITLNHVRTLRAYSRPNDGIEDKTREEKVATFELMSIVARQITAEAKKLSTNDRKAIRSAYLTWEFEGEKEEVFENWLGNNMNILAHPFKVALIFVIGAPFETPVIRECKLFEFPTERMKAVWSEAQTEGA